MAKQTKLQSLLEVLCGTFLGFVGSWAITYVIFRYVTDIALAALLATLACTVWSIARGYYVRRYFAGKH